MKHIIIILTICVITSCGQSQSSIHDDSKIICGKWKYIGNDMDYHELIFKENGAYSMRIYWGNEKSYNEINAKYSINDSVIKIVDDTSSNELEYNLKSNKLTIKKYIQFEKGAKKVVKDALYEKIE